MAAPLAAVTSVNTDDEEAAIKQETTTLHRMALARAQLNPDARDVPTFCGSRPSGSRLSGSGSSRYGAAFV